MMTRKTVSWEKGKNILGQKMLTGGIKKMIGENT